MKVEDAFVEGITQIANYRLKKKHPDLAIKEWEVRAVLEALVLFQQEYENDREQTQ